MPAFLLGMNAKMYYGAAGGPANTLITNVRNVTLSLEAGEADVTTRANQGWRATVATLRECTVEFEMVWDPADAAFAAIRTAYLPPGGLIALKILDRENGQGIDGDFAISRFTIPQEMEEAIKVSVTAKLAVFRAWAGGEP